jgi:4-aminobutyrate aminotransferase
MSVTGNRSWSASALSPLRVSYVHNGDRYRTPFSATSDAQFIATCAADLRNVIETTTSGDVACMIAEPIQGVGGFVIPPDGFFAAMKNVLDEYGILFISDEVQTGWGRTGEHFWGIEAHGVVPDLMTFAKGLGNGLAIGGVVGRGALIDSVHASSISTFGGNPLASTGALANIEYLLANDLQANARSVGKVMLDALFGLLGRVPIVGDVRGKGLMLAVELVEPGTKTPAPASTVAVLEEARRRGVLIGKGGLYGNILRISPPLSLSHDEALSGLDALIGAIEAVNASVPPA